MSLKALYAGLLLVLAAVVTLCLAWEFWLEDSVMPGLVSYHEPEPPEDRWEFVATVGFFVAVVLLGPAFIGTRIIRQDEALRRAIVRMSEEDYLTGLCNRRRISELLQDEIHRAARYETAFSVLLIDIDHFKSVNDRLGHQAGDRVLIEIAELIRSSVRAADLLGRWGGEEFVVISPQTGIGGALLLAEKIRGQIQSAKFRESGRQTASVGVAAFAAGDDLKSIVARADAALYAAKQSGRNRVESMTHGADVGVDTVA